MYVQKIDNEINALYSECVIGSWKFCSMNEAVSARPGCSGAEADPIADSNCQRIRAGDPEWRCGEEKGVDSEDWG
jgi:hypothetical protein